MKGLNSAATLWATAAVGALAGAWMWREAIAGAAIIVAANWFLQLLANRMDRASTKGGRDVTSAEYTLEVVCDRQVEAEVKTAIAAAMPRPQFQLVAVRAQPTFAADQSELRVDYATARRDARVAEDAIRTLSQRPGVNSARWSIADEEAADWAR